METDDCMKEKLLSEMDDDLLDAEILALADGDTTEEASSPEMGSEFQEEYSEILRTGHNLRHRSMASSREESSYLAPWQRERLRQRNKRAGVTTRNDEDEKDISKGPMSLLSPTRAPPGEYSEDARAIVMLREAAEYLEQNAIPCTSPNCPATHPHGEGPYLFQGRVPDSELANVYFAPSIPPPSVVQAFNNLDALPSWQDLDMKDRFFNYHTAPCRPSKYLDKVGKLQCKSKNCGVEVQPHQKGAYLHGGLDGSLHLSRRLHHAFGISNPPPEVWDSAIRIQNGNATERDKERVDDFSAHHTRWDTGDARRAEMMSWQKERRSERP
ncbi:MAG: hypothetical protein Q9209_007267 [Squamulea sp. 1 TL-2023]